MHIKTYGLGGDGGVHMLSYIDHVYSNGILLHYYVTEREKNWNIQHN